MDNSKNMEKICTGIVFLVFLCLKLCTNAGAFNVDELMKEYSAACGNMLLCSEQPLFFPYTKLNRCPKCSCEDDCFQTNTCCPDKFFRSTYKVFTNFVMEFANDHNSESYDKYEAIVNCPVDAQSSLKKRCESSMTPHRMINNPPVTSLVTNASYSNRHCASCHGEMSTNLIPWDLGFGKAPIPAIAYTISRFNELVNIGELMQVPLLFIPSPLIKNRVKKMPVEFILTKCPADTDTTIKQACESSYYLRFRYHQNIFCYICNMPSVKITDKLITNCNVTGHWDVKDQTIEDTCAERNASAMTYPYKNFYCFLCNTISDPDNSLSVPSEGADVVHNYDAFFEYEECYQFDWSNREKHEIKIKNIVFRNEEMYRTINNKEVKNDDVLPIGEGMHRWMKYLIDIKSLVQRKVAVYPDRVCDKTLLPESIREYTETNCECGVDCLFRNVCSCCVDTALKTSVSCLSDTLLSKSSLRSSENEIIVIDGCSENENYMFFHKYQKLCEDDTGDFSSHFVSYGSAVYKNVFCFFCNSNLFRLGTKLLYSTFTPLDLNIVCPVFFHFLYTDSIKDIIKLAKNQRCAVYFDTDKATMCRKEEEDGGFGGSLYGVHFPGSDDFGNDGDLEQRKMETIKVCNASGDVQNNIDFNIRWACENVSEQAFPPSSGFKNEFCLICNSNNTIQTVLETCSVDSVNFHPAYSDGCSLLPDVSSVSGVHPYKNSFCFACNNEYCIGQCFPNSAIVLDKGSCSSERGSALQIRPLLEFQKLQPSVIFNVSPNVAIKWEKYGCYPGRVLVGYACELIIRKAIGTYAVDVSTKLTIYSTIKNASTVLRNLETALRKHIVHVLPGNVGTIRNMYILPHQDSQVITANSLLLADIYFEVSYVNYNRKLVEQRLVRLPYQGARRFTSDDGTLHYSITFLKISLPRDTIDNSNPDTVAYQNFIKRMRFLFSGPPFVVHFVNNLLLCIHQKYNFSLLFFDYENLRVISNETGLSFTLAEFVVDDRGLVGVCGSTFFHEKEIMFTPADLEEDLQIIFTVNNGISAVCVASVFFSYCFFKNLRTPSGVNVMFVSFFLCWFHIVRMLVKLLQSIPTACLVIGFVRHYGWLSTCCSLCVSSFHQFFLFRDHNLKNDDESSELKARSPVLLHLLFSCLFPLLVVSLNAVFLFVFLPEIQYNPDLCFLNHEISTILSFLAPLAITVILTFSINCVTLKLVISSSLKRKKSEFLLLFKCITIIGVLIVFQVTEWFVNSANFSLAVDLIVSLQGCTVLLVFCCACKVEGENSSENDSFPSLETEKNPTSIYDQ